MFKVQRLSVATALTILILTGTLAHAEPDPKGFIYGTVETSSGNSYTGFLRWGTEEAFWDDLFNSVKHDLPDMDRLRRDRRDDRRRSVRVFGKEFSYRHTGSSSRMFIARFGDIREIVPQRGDRVEVLMKSGEMYELDGGSNDIGAKITVKDESLGEVKLSWSKIDSIKFSPAPNRADPPAHRLFGKLITEDGSFEGFIQWDSQECLYTDKLDGDSEDGDLSIAMGKIRSIEKRGRNGSDVELKDGRRIYLDDSNDVNSSNRGIFVEDERIGRVKVSWDAFRSVEFRETKRSGRGYTDYRPASPLRGRVIDFDDRTIRGMLVYDLDERETWELLNGDADGVDYYIPFEMIRTIQPGRRDSSDIKLRNGTELTLEDGQDVAERNAGVLVIREDSDREAYVPWRDILRIEFD